MAFAWPLPARLSTHLTGPLDSDAAVYVWNQWVFHHELVENRSLPYFTGKIFSITPKANLSLHNYTTFANALAAPLIPWLGVVATFNLVFLAITVLTAYAMFLLALDLTGGSETESWLAGLLFAWSPVLVTRGGGHFSLVAAAPLPIFFMLLLRAPAAWSWRKGAGLGLVMAWAATSDAYYGVFCLVLAAVVLAASLFRVRRAAPTVRSAAVARSLEVAMVLLAGLAAAIAISRGWRLTFLGKAVSFHTLYTPVLLLTLVLLARLAVRYRPTLPRLDRNGVLAFLRAVAATGIVCSIALSPVLLAMGYHIADDRWYGGSATFWRSSTPGIDLAALVLPNPNHPLAPTALRDWVAARPNGYLENVATIPFVALAVIASAWWRGWRPPRVLAAVAAAFGLLSLGPFVQIVGTNAYVPGPWALLRYVPVIGLARSPSRFTVVLMLSVAALFALALQSIAAGAARRRLLLAAVSALLAFELLPAPRELFAVTLPPFYQTIAADPRPDVRVLELPFGVRDGTRSVGNFTARSQFFQIFHHKPLIGGYLSRVSHRRVEEIRRFPVLDALIMLSEGGTISAGHAARVEARASAFIERARIGYVVLDRRRTPPALADFAMRVFRLQPVDRSGDLELYLPGI